MSDKPEQVAIRVPLDTLIRKMREEKDIHVVMAADGSFSAVCKDCQEGLQIAQQDWLMWFRCPNCGRLSFSPMENLRRDAEIAGQMGGRFEYEVYFFKSIPPELKPPTEWK